MMINNPRISIIIPAYNSEKTIITCVDSVISQSYNNIEIIIVDDGSTDSTGSIIDDLALHNEKITAFHQKNSGQNKARAYGFANATGDWITFVDSDDTLVNNAIERLVGSSSLDTDIVVGFSFDNQQPLHRIPINKWRSDLIKSDIILCTPWGKLFRKTILNPEVYDLYTINKTATDMPMNIKISFRTDKDVIAIPGKIYNYSSREDSLSQSAKWTIKKISFLYKDVFLSIPDVYRDSFIFSLIENRITAIERKIINNNKYNRETFGGCKYIKELRNDIHQSGYQLSVIHFLLIYWPDSIFTEIFFKVKRKCIIWAQFIKRVCSA